MTLTVGTKLGPYEVLSAINAGGMGTVWKARDTRLDRIVAIKTIEGHFSERFEREAKTIASLNHPHICTLFDVGENYLVMEFIEGAPVKGPLPVSEVVRLGAQICEALDAAHRKGITHRDLKPANVLINRSGVKVIDFGLAKGGSPVRGEQDVTLTKPLTAEGTILGTVPYMSPEQLQGQEADARSDMFALGCVLYEMLTGRRAFDGKSQVSIMAAILEHEPAPLTEPVVPFWLDRIVRRCLRKNPEDRWQSARDVAIELREPPPQAAAAPASAATSKWPWIVALLLALGAMGWLAATRVSPPPAAPVLRVLLNAPENHEFLSASTQTTAAPSPDGHLLAFVTRSANVENQDTLWIRPLDTLEPRALVTGQRIRNPCWSPDGGWVAYNMADQIRKTEVATGRSVTIVAESTALLPAEWSRDGAILLFGDGRLWRVEGSGGTPRQIAAAAPSSGESYGSPGLSSDGRTLVFSTYKGDRPPIIQAAPLDQPSALKRITEGYSPQLVAAAGRNWLLYGRADDVVAQEFDTSRREVAGPIHSLSRLDTSTNVNRQFAISQQGTLLIVHGATRASSQPVWFTRQGAARPAGPPGPYRQPRLAPDGKLAVLEVAESQTTRVADLWTLDTERGVLSRLVGTKDRWEYHPVWSRDGAEILYASNRRAGVIIRRRMADGNETEVFSYNGRAMLGDWSPDSAWFVYTSGTGGLNAASAAGKPGQQPVRLTNTTSQSERYPRISPDGKWVAFSSAESGKSEIYVIHFDPTRTAVSPKYAVSGGGGDMPAWRGDGKEIFFVALDGKMMAAPVVSLGDAPRFGTPQPLFDTAIDMTLSSFDVTRDGQHFLVLKVAGVPKPGFMEVVVNWPGLIARQN